MIYIVLVSASDVVLIAGNSPHNNKINPNPNPNAQSQVPIPIHIPGRVTIPRVRTRVTASSNARE